MQNDPILLTFILKNSPQAVFLWHKLKEKYQCLTYNNINDFKLSNYKKNLCTHCYR